MALTFGSLFAGIGGIDLGFERAGMECQWQVEIDDYATQVLTKHWPNVRRWRDIRTFPPHPYHEWQVDVIAGGFPCQDISYAGRGAGLAGERSGLFFEVIRVVRKLRPRYVVLENVAALLTRGLDVVLGTLAEVGYDAEWHCIPAAAVGAPHIRDRVFILAYTNRIGLERPEHEREWFGIMQRTSNVCEDVANTNGDGFSKEPNKQKKQVRVETSRWGNPARRCLDSRVRLTANSEWWATEPAVARVANGIPHRVDRLRCLGNSVVPQVAELVGRSIVEFNHQLTRGQQ